jgi:hypothetical protein
MPDSGNLQHAKIGQREQVFSKLPEKQKRLFEDGLFYPDQKKQKKSTRELKLYVRVNNSSNRCNGQA